MCAYKRVDAYTHNGPDRDFINLLFRAMRAWLLEIRIPNYIPLSTDSKPSLFIFKYPIFSYLLLKNSYPQKRTLANHTDSLLIE